MTFLASQSTRMEVAHSDTYEVVLAGLDWYPGTRGTARYRELEYTLDTWIVVAEEVAETHTKLVLPVDTEEVAGAKH